MAEAGNTTLGSSQHGVTLEEISKMFAKVVKSTKKLKKSSQTNSEIKTFERLRDLDLLVGGISRRFNQYQSKQIGVIEHREKRNVIYVHTDTSLNKLILALISRTLANRDDIELIIRLKEQDYLRMQIIVVMVRDTDFELISGYAYVGCINKPYKGNGLWACINKPY
ncbi:hypothetical protein QE152_g4605 [Popillia japonica]|uniref:Uncharacterized protein n=1 Tax=Popillia japonica TaxID=7064 RepID=A0AAW1MXF6_POPJA